jgi:hypothetical protein
MDAAGTMRVPLDAPGIGVAVDEARVDGLTVRREVLTAAPGSPLSAPGDGTR